MKKSLLGLSLLTISCLYGLLAAIIILLSIALGGEVLIAIFVSIAILIIQFLISPWLTDLSMKWFYKAKFDQDIPEYLQKFIEEMCQKHNIKYPKIGYIDDGAPNAFTYGRTKKSARIILTRGILEMLSEDEVKAVTAHEIGHIVHYDMLFMTAVQIVPLVLYAIYETFTNSDNDENKAALIGVIAYILYLISQYIILFLSRKREYYADSFALEQTNNPTALAESLVKVGFGLSTSPRTTKHNVSKNNALGIFDVSSSKSLVVSCVENKQVSKVKITNAMKWEMWNPWATWYELHSTHPLISKRLLAISKRCPEFKQTPYIEFNLKKTESYADDFGIELLIKLIPIISIIAVTILLLATELERLLIIGLGVLALTIGLIIAFRKSHQNKNYKETNVSELLGEVKVSGVTSIPCTVKGNIIGRGNPGCIFNEDFVIKDDTGIIFIDYNQPLYIMNKYFAIFKSEEYFDKVVTIKGWYRRSPVPYIEIKEMEVDDKTKKIHTFTVRKIIYIILLIISAILIYYGLFG